jgi:hypothetical protein
MTVNGIGGTAAKDPVAAAQVLSDGDSIRPNPAGGGK